jgi:hypothetical protein
MARTGQAEDECGWRGQRASRQRLKVADRLSGCHHTCLASDCTDARTRRFPAPHHHVALGGALVVDPFFSYAPFASCQVRVLMDDGVGRGEPMPFVLFLLGRDAKTCNRSLFADDAITFRGVLVHSQERLGRVDYGGHYSGSGTIEFDCPAGNGPDGVNAGGHERVSLIAMLAEIAQAEVPLSMREVAGLCSSGQSAA